MVTSLWYELLHMFNLVYFACQGKLVLTPPLPIPLPPKKPQKNMQFKTHREPTSIHGTKLYTVKLAHKDYP